MANRTARMITAKELIHEITTTFKDSVFLMLTNQDNDSRTVYIASDMQIFKDRLHATITKGEFDFCVEEIGKALSESTQGVNDD